MLHFLLLYHVICMNWKPYLLPCESTCAYGSPISSSSIVCSNLLPSIPVGYFPLQLFTATFCLQSVYHPLSCRLCFLLNRHLDHFSTIGIKMKINIANQCAPIFTVIFSFSQGNISNEISTQQEESFKLTSNNLSSW